MSNTTKTWDLLNAFKTALESINIAADYYTDAGNNVTLEPSQIPQGVDPVITVVLDGLQRSEDPAMRGMTRAYLATVLVGARVPTTQTDAQQVLHQLLDDIHRALFDRRDVFPAGTQYPRFVEAQVIPPAEGMNWIGAELRWTAHVRPR